MSKTEEAATVEEAPAKAPVKPRAKAGAKVPTIYTAIHNVISELRVDKDGLLPGNKGGKSYRTAEALTSAVRDLFATHGIVLVSNEEVVTEDIFEHRDRNTYYIIVKGTYELVSIADGSSITVSGIGRGQDIGATTDANIASTFAFKNAIQRVLLVADNQDEEAGMNDGTPSRTAQERAAAGAAKGQQGLKRAPAPVKGKTARPAPSKAQVDEELAKNKVRDQFVKTGILSGSEANAEMAKIKETGSKTPYQDLLAKLEKGELTDA